MVEYLLDDIKELSLDIHQKDQDGWNALFYTIQGQIPPPP